MLVKKRLRHNIRKDDFLIVMADDEHKQMQRLVDGKGQEVGLNGGTWEPLNYDKTMEEYSVDKIIQEKKIQGKQNKNGIYIEE